MRYPVNIPAMEGRSVEVVTSPWTGAITVLVNGTPAERSKKRGEFFVIRPDGQRTVIQFIPKFAFDGVLRITVDGEPQVLGVPLTPVEMIFVWIPIVLLFVGGLIGGVCAGIAVSLNLALFRSASPSAIKYLGALITAAGAFLLFLLISIPVYQYTHPSAANSRMQTTPPASPLPR